MIPQNRSTIKLYSQCVIHSNNIQPCKIKRQIKYLQPQYASYKKHQISKLIKRSDSQNYKRILSLSPPVKDNFYNNKNTKHEIQQKISLSKHKQSNQMYQTPKKLISNNLSQVKVVYHNSQMPKNALKIKQVNVKPLLIQNTHYVHFVAIQQNYLNSNQFPYLTKQSYKEKSKNFGSYFKNGLKDQDNFQECLDTVQNIDLNFQMKVLRLNQNLSKLMEQNPYNYDNQHY